MDKTFIDIPIKTTLLPIKQRCTNVYIIGGIDGIVRWEYEKKQLKFEKYEINEFLGDTQAFVKTLGIELNLAGYHPQLRTRELMQKVFAVIDSYYKKWGAFIRIKNNEISLPALLRSCFVTYVSLNLWHTTYIFDNLKIFLNPDNLKDDPEKIISWYAGLVYNHVRDCNEIWLPETKDTQYPEYSADNPDYPVYSLRIRRPSIEEYNDKYRDSPPNLINYVRDEILESLSRYTRKQTGIKPNTIKLEKGYFSFELKTDNLLLAYLIFNLPGFLKEKIKQCKCGCGNPVPGRGKYLPGHYAQKLAKREKKPDRVLKAWIRMRRKRGNITEKQCEYYYSIIDEELRKNTSEKDIRAKLESLMEV